MNKSRPLLAIISGSIKRFARLSSNVLVERLTPAVSAQLFVATHDITREEVYQIKISVGASAAETDGYCIKKM
jgi:hypothetical protein